MTNLQKALCTLFLTVGFAGTNLITYQLGRRDQALLGNGLSPLPPAHDTFMLGGKAYQCEAGTLLVSTSNHTTWSPAQTLEASPSDGIVPVIRHQTPDLAR